MALESGRRTCRQLSQLLFGIAVVAVVSGCRSAGAGSNSRVRTEVELSSSVLKLGDTLRVAVHFINGGDEPIVIEANGCNGHFKVIAANGAAVGPGEGYVCLASSSPRRISVGSQFTWTGIWTGRSGGGFAPAPPGLVPAGSYRIVGEAVLSGRDVPFARGRAIVEVVR